MAGKTLRDLLGFVAFMEEYKQIKSGVPKLLPEAFYTPSPMKVRSDRTRQLIKTGSRATSKRVAWGGVPARIDQLSTGSKDIVLCHTLESMAFDPHLLHELRNARVVGGDGIGDAAADQILYQTAEMKQRSVNTRISTIMTALSLTSQCTINWDVNGNLLPSQSSADLTIDFGVPANNKNQCNSALTASWATASTDIPSNIKTLKTNAAQLTGKDLTHCFYGKNLPSNLAKNDFVKDYWSHSSRNTEWLTSNEIPDGFLGIQKWIPVYTGFFEDASGTNQALFAADQCTFTPDPEEFYKLLEGTALVPNAFGKVSQSLDVVGMLEMASTRVGQYAFAMGSIDSGAIEISIVQGDTWLPMINSVGAACPIFACDFEF